MNVGRLAAGLAVGLGLGWLIAHSVGPYAGAGWGHVVLWPFMALFGLAFAIIGLAIAMFFAFIPILLLAALIVLVVKLVQRSQRPRPPVPDEVAIDGP